jgi:hypothetical protein
MTLPKLIAADHLLCPGGQEMGKGTEMGASPFILEPEYEQT